MRRGSYFALAAALSACGVAHAANRVDIEAGDLGSALARLAASRDVELLFDRNLMVGRRAPAYRSSADTDDILATLLAGSGFSFRRTPEGAYLITPVKKTEPSEAHIVEPAVAVPDILVVGRRTLNTDIRRREDDIEPYTVVGANGDIERSQTQTLDSFLKDFVPSNTQLGLAIQSPSANSGSTLSRIDLRGFGPADTLLLIDGRRLPAIADTNGFLQPNVNGLPLEAIDRVEILSSTAGGIFGPGATAGAVNVILKRDYHGLDITTSDGITSRGDAPYSRLAVHAGHTSRDGKTRASLTFSYSDAKGLELGDRPYPAAARALQFNTVPEAYIPPYSPSINIQSEDFDYDTYRFTDLSLKPQYGGGSLGANKTFLSVASAGTAKQAAELLAHAGAYDLRLSSDGDGAKQSLLSGVRTLGATLDVRHEFNPAFEVFADIVGWRTTGSANVRFASNYALLWSANDPRNPFEQDIAFTVSMPGRYRRVTSETSTWRATTGVIIRLPSSWSMEEDISLARSFSTIAPMGTYGFGSYRTFDPFQGEAAFNQQLQQVNEDPRDQNTSYDHLFDQSLRAAGPLFNLAGGPATLTMVTEARVERSPGFSIIQREAYQDVEDDVFRYQPLRQSVVSGYAELRAPVTGEDFGFWPLRQLELQGAFRKDWTKSRYSTDINDFPDEGNVVGSRVSDTANTTSFTVGARVRPLPSIMLRSSLATGFLPSGAQDVVSSLLSGSVFAGVRSGNDPMRGGSAVPVGTEIDIIPGKLRLPHMTSFSAGLVFSPPRLQNLRLSLDYTRIRKSRIPFDFYTGDVSYILAHPSLFPGVVVREPLTDEDRAAGYSGGSIDAIIVPDSSLRSQTAQALDVAAEYRFKSRLGQFVLYLNGSWEPSFTLRDYPGGPTYNLAGRADGPIKLKGNVGLDWTQGPWSLSANLQLWGRYRVTHGYTTGGNLSLDDLTVLEMGTDHIRAQAYLDLTMGRRFRMPNGSALDLRLGVRNLLDTAAPVFVGDYSSSGDSQPPTGYSLATDPRGRRFEFAATAHF